MGHLRASAVSGYMRHEALTYGRTTAAGPWGRPRACGLAERCILARRLKKRRSLWLPCRADCAFRSPHCPGGVGPNPPARLRGTMESGPTGQTRSGNPPPGCGGLRQGPQASAWGLAARKDAVWAEGLADGAPQARSGYHQAASCGLRRCRELRFDFLRSAEKVRRRV